MKKLQVAMMAAVLGVAHAWGQAGGWRTLPSTGYWQELLHLGADFNNDMLTGKDGIGGDQLATFGCGSQTAQRPWPGLTYAIPADYVHAGSAANLVWTEVRNAADGSMNAWAPVPNKEEYIKYWHIYIFSPDAAERLVMARFKCDDDLRAWNNGSLFCTRDNWDNNVELTYETKLYPGINSITIKLREGTSGDRMAMRLTDRLGNAYSDLKYSLDTRLVLSNVRGDDLTQTSATISALLTNTSGENCTISVGIAATDLGADPAAWQTVFTLDGVNAGAVSIPVSGLTDNTPYIARVFAQNSQTSAISDAFSFTTYNATPAVVSLAADPVGGTTATARGQLLYAGGADTADVTLHWGTANGTITGTWDHDELLGAMAAGALSCELNDLTYNTTYYYMFAAGAGVSPEVVSFTTLGAPIFGATSASLFSDRAKLSAILESAGVNEVTISCWMGTSPGALSQVHEWPATTNPQTFSWLSGTLIPGDTWYYAFKAVSTLPAPVGPVEIWTATNAFVVGNRTLIWDNKASNNQWNTGSLNWHLSGQANGTALFRNGDSASFATATTLALGENIDVNAVSAPAGLILQGDNTLSVYDNLNLSAGASQILTPKLSGPGAIALTSGSLALGNAANDFTGGISVQQGTVSGQTTGGHDTTVFGNGVIRLGATSGATASAILALTGSDNDVSIPAGITTTGAHNDARISFSGSTLHTSRILRDPGASMTLVSKSVNNFGSELTEKFFIDTPPSGIFPPWFVITEAWGDYATYDPILGVRRAVIADTAFTGSDTFVRPPVNATLAADEAATALLLAGNLNLAGHTLTLGDTQTDGGLLIRNNNTVIADPSSLIHIGGDSLMVYTEAAPAIIQSGFTPNGILRKFGTGTLRLTGATLPAALNIQNGTLTLSHDNDITVATPVFGAGILRKEGSGTLTITGESPVDTREVVQAGGAIIVDGRDIKTSTLRLAQTRGENFTLLNGATVTASTGMAWGGKTTPSTITLEAGTLLDTTSDFRFGEATANANTGTVRSASAAHGGLWNCNGKHINPAHGFTPNTADNCIIFDNVTISNVWFGGGDSGGKRRSGIILRNNARAWPTGVRLADKLGYDSYFRVTEGSQADFTGTIHITMNNGDNNVIQVDGPGSIIRQHAGEFNINYNLDGTINYDNAFIVSNGGTYRRVAGSTTLRHAYGNSGTVMQRNKLHVTGSGSLFDGNSLLSIDFANGLNSQGCTNNWIIVDNHGVMTNLNNIALATTAAKASCANTIRLADGGVLHMSGTLTIGNAVNRDNGLILAGGALLANNLTLTANNLIGVEIQPDGLRESHIKQTATFASGTQLRLSAAPNARTGLYRVLTADGVLTDNGLIPVLPANPTGVWNWYIKGNTLFISFTKPTLFMVR